MFNNVMRFATAILTVGFLSGVVLAQNGSPSGAPQEPCWKQAGISRSIMEQRHEIEREIHSQVDAVCQNSSLSLHEKQVQAREIRRQGQQKIDALMTPEQQSTLRACQQQRGNRSANEGRHTGAGPCGNMGAPQGPQGPANENAQPPADPQK
jgi:Spy/CpxP family protein refolding chaperone